MLVVPDALRDDRFRHLPAVVGFPFVPSYAGVPVVDRRGYALGALCVCDREPFTGSFDAIDLMIRGRQGRTYRPPAQQLGFRTGGDPPLATSVLDGAA